MCRRLYKKIAMAQTESDLPEDGRCSTRRHFSAARFECPKATAPSHRLRTGVIALRWAEPEVGSLELGVAARNAFNRAPPVVVDPTAQIAYDPANATTWGRELSVFGGLRW
jgi:hypothetical protein